MAIEYVAPLTFLWDFLSPLLSDTIKEKFILVSSEKKAKKKAFDLFQVLERVKFDTNEFINALEAFVVIVTDNIESKDFGPAKEGLLNAIDDLSGELNQLKRILQEMNLQMNIHLPEVLEDINRYRGSRDVQLSISSRLAQLNSFSKRDKDELNSTLKTAKDNRLLINRAIDHFRIFIKNEFSFKESF